MLVLGLRLAGGGEARHAPDLQAINRREQRQQEDDESHADAGCAAQVRPHDQTTAAFICTRAKDNCALEEGERGEIREKHLRFEEGFPQEN